MTSLVGELLLIGILILINGFFAGAEAALIAVRRSHVNELAAHHGPAGRALKILKDAPDKFLATVQFGVTVVGTLASVLSGATVVQALAPGVARLPWEFTHRWPEQIAIVIVVVAIAFATLVIGELVPKYLAITRPESMALRVARPIHWLSRIGYPIVMVLTGVSRFITRLLGVNATDQALPVSDQEIRHLVLEGRLHGSIHPTEHHLIHQVLDFSDTTARQIMTPRPDIAAIDIVSPIEETLRLIREEGYSRYPVYEQTIDKIRGVVYTKDIIHLMTEDSPIILTDLVRPVVFVPDSMPIVKVLAKFQSEHRHMAIVLDEFGGTAGLLTMEDILEEIVGEIQDEYDAEPSDFQILADGSAIVSGGLSIIDFNERFGAQLPSGRADTLAGLMSVALDRIPHRGDHLELEGVRLEVASREGRRVRLLRVRKIPE